MTLSTSTYVPGPAAWVSVVLGYAVAAVVLVLRLFGSDLPLSLGVAGAIGFTVVLCVPPTLALLAMRGRTRLFAAAGMLSITFSVPMSILGLVMIPIGIAWLLMQFKSRPDDILRVVGTVAVVWVLGIASMTVLLMHIDPRCATTYTDGTVETTNVGESGWIWDIGNTSTGDSRILGTDVVAEYCTSEVVTPIESFAAILLAAAALGSGWVIAGEPEQHSDIVDEEV